MWKADEHSDQENLQWCWLRAVEWGRWPIFLSQAFAPLSLLFLSWQAVIIIVMALNIVWAMFIRYKYVSVGWAFFGVIISKLKWINSPLMGYYFFSHDQSYLAAIALFWPLLIFIIGAVPTTQIGTIQNMFMAELGYNRHDATSNDK